METHFYHVDLTWTSDRKGVVSSPELNVIKDSTLEVATPPEFSGGIPGIWSPEHLFVASVNSCYMTTFLAIAENSKLEFSRFNCSALGKLEVIENRYQISEITLKPSLLLDNENQLEKAQRILEKSEKACLISNSIKSKIILEPEVLITALHN